MKVRSHVLVFSAIFSFINFSTVQSITCNSQTAANSCFTYCCETTTQCSSSQLSACQYQGTQHCDNLNCNTCCMRKSFNHYCGTQSECGFETPVTSSVIASSAISNNLPPAQCLFDAIDCPSQCCDSFGVCVQDIQQCVVYTIYNCQKLNCSTCCGLFNSAVNNRCGTNYECGLEQNVSLDYTTNANQTTPLDEKQEKDEQTKTAAIVVLVVAIVLCIGVSIYYNIKSTQKEAQQSQRRNQVGAVVVNTPFQPMQNQMQYNPQPQPINYQMQNNWPQAGNQQYI